MRSQEDDRPRFSTLHHEVRHQLGIGWSEYVLIDFIYHLSAKYGRCLASTSHLARLLGQSFNGTKKMIERLVERELLAYESNGLICTNAYTDIAYTHNDGTTIKIAKSAKIALSATNRGGKLRKVQKIAKSVDSNNINKKIYKKSLVDTFNHINQILQTKSRYSEAYGRLLTKALGDFTVKELEEAATHFYHQFHGGSEWHSRNPKFYTLKQFFGNDKDGMPRYQTYYEQSLLDQPRKIVQPANPHLHEYFPELKHESHQ